MPALTRRRDHDAPDRPKKITFGDMRDTGVRGILIYCSDYKWKSTAPADHQMIDDRQ